MPEEVLLDYKLSGRQTVTVYSEAEMADALGLTCVQLRHELSSGNLVYHAHPSATDNREYEFSAESYNTNLVLWACLCGGGHYYEFDGYLDYTQSKTVYDCTNCGHRKYYL